MIFSCSRLALSLTGFFDDGSKIATKLVRFSTCFPFESGSDSRVQTKETRHELVYLDLLNPEKEKNILINTGLSNGKIENHLKQTQVG